MDRATYAVLYCRWDAKQNVALFLDSRVGTCSCVGGLVSDALLLGLRFRAYKHQLCVHASVYILVSVCSAPIVEPSFVLFFVAPSVSRVRLRSSPQKHDDGTSQSLCILYVYRWH